MRRAIYQGMLRLPVKVVGSTIGIAGFIGSVWPEAVRTALGSRMMAETVQLIGVICLVVAVMYFALLWLLKPSEPGVGAASGGPTTYGPHSPNIGNVRGDVHFHPPPPAPIPGEPLPPRGPIVRRLSEMEIEVANAHARKRWAAGVDGLHRVLTGQSGGKQPDLPLAGLLAKLYKVLGPVPSGEAGRREFYRKIDLAIADKVHMKNLSVWARKNEQPLSFLVRLYSARFDHRQNCVSVEDASSIHREAYYDLHFNKAEIDEAWPDA